MSRDSDQKAREDVSSGDAGGGADAQMVGRSTRTAGLPPRTRAPTAGLPDPLPPWQGPPVAGAEDPFAVHLLGTRASAGPVQRKAHVDLEAVEAGIERAYTAPQDAAAYFGIHWRMFLDTIDHRVAVLTLQQPHARLRLAGGLADAFRGALLDATGGDRNVASKLSELLHPSDPWVVIDRHRHVTEGEIGNDREREGARAKGPIKWNLAAGQAIAVEVEARLRESIGRMAPRYIAQADDLFNAPVTPEMLVTSHPFDRIVARLLCDERVARYDKGHQRKGENAAGGVGAGVFREGLRLVQYEWQGDRDARLWNWVRAIEPVDATPEEVSAAIFESHGSEFQSQYAYGIIAAAPFFGLPPAWARTIPGAREHARPAQYDRFKEPGAGDLAMSAVADEAALAQVSDEVPGTRVAGPDRAHLLELLDRSDEQLTFAWNRLHPWKLGGVVYPAKLWIQRHRSSLASASPEDLRRWAPVVEGQQQILFEASGAVVETLEAAAGAGVKAESPASRPVRDALEGYATAMAEAHLVDTARAQLARAHGQRAMMPLALLDTAMSEATSAAGDLKAAEGKHYSPDSDGHAAVSENNDLMRRQVALRSQVVAGQAIDPEEVEDLALDVAEQSLVARSRELALKVRSIAPLARQANDGTLEQIANVFASDITELPRRIEEIAASCDAIPRIITLAMREAGLGPVPSDPEDQRRHRRAMRDVQRRALAEAQQSFLAIPNKFSLAHFFQRALDTIKNAQVRALIVSVALMIGISLAAGGVAAAVASGVRGAMLADAAIGTAEFLATASRARMVAGGAQLASEAGLNAAGQTLVLDDNVGASFLENLIGNAAIIGALQPFHRLTATWGALDDEALALWTKHGKLALAKGAIVTAEMVTAAAVGYVAQQIVRGPQKQAGEEQISSWAVQGASMAIGRYVGGRLTQLNHRLAQLGEGLGESLRQRVLAQIPIANRIAATGDRDGALALLTDDHVLLAEEKRLLQKLDSEPALLARAGLSLQDHARLAAGNETALADSNVLSMQELPLRLAGMDEVVPGAVWSGTPQQIKAGLREARRMGIDATTIAYDEVTGRSIVKLGDRQLELVERRGAADAAPVPIHDHPTGPMRAVPGAEAAPAMPAAAVEPDLAAPHASPADREAIQRVLSLDPDEGQRLVREYGDELTDHLRTNPLTTLADLSTTLAKQRSQVKHRVDGFYEGIDTTKPPQGWQFHDSSRYEPDGTTVLTTVVRGPNRAEGRFTRAYNPQDGQLDLREAFLRMSGEDVALPNMVKKQGASQEMIEGKGSPTVQYITLYQMKKLGVPLGGSSGSGVETIHMSDIQNVETIVHAHYLRNKLGLDTSEIIDHTASVKYAVTTAIQAGYQRTAPPLVYGGQETPIRDVLEFQEGGNKAREGENNQILAKYGYDRDTVMYWGFDIDFRVRPNP